MAYKDILVLIDTTPQCPARIRLAVKLAQKHQAHLTGLYVVSHHFGLPRFEAETHDITEMQRLFEKETAEAGVPSEWCVGDWTVSYESVAAVVNHYACLKDLVVVGQVKDGAQGNQIPADLPERIVAGSGRPVLIIPSAGSFATVGDKVMVCWRHGRESVRALTGAMPFLAGSQDVRIVTINPSDTVVKTGEKEDGVSAELMAHLSRHGISARMERVAGAEIPVGDMLLNESWEEGCDLLVMGAYMHSSQGAVKTGPVARHLLKHMTLPVLMAH